MLREFWNDKRGNYAMMTAILMVPLLGAVGLAVDYTEMVRHKNATRHALDAAGIATARRITEGAAEAELLAYAQDFFAANLGPVDPKDAKLTVSLPTLTTGGGLLTLNAELKYEPHIMGAFQALVSGATDTDINFDTEAQFRLKNTSEIALVLDNSGSMRNKGSGTSKKRIDLLKEAAKYLIVELGDQANSIQKVNKPVQFAVVPFSASVNVGANNAGASWMDQTGLSPVHNENFDWTTLEEAFPGQNKRARKSGDRWIKNGAGWGKEDGKPLTRWSLFDAIEVVKKETGKKPEGDKFKSKEVCEDYKSNGECDDWETVWYTTEKLTSWKGCVEARPYPYNTNDAEPTTAKPATLFVPMFAPDEADTNAFKSYNSWWEDDFTGSPTGNAYTAKKRQANMGKYFVPAPKGKKAPGMGSGMHYSCTTTPITPLTDATKASGITVLEKAIDAMAPTGMTDVPQGLAWGLRAVSSKAPFPEGRLESEKGNDKIIIVLTDGANTYSDLSNNSGRDPAGNKSRYAAYGYTGVGYDGGSTTRLFMGTDGNVKPWDFSGGNYTRALDDHMKSVCDQAKSGDVIIFTVGLDLPTNSSAVTALRECASDSRLRKDAGGNPKKLFYNTKGGDLLEVFKTIADELSNLRIVS